MTSQPEDVVVLPPETTFYLNKENQTYGPHTVAEVRAFLQAGVVRPEHFLWAEGMEEWLPIEKVFDLIHEQTKREPARESVPPQVEEVAGDPASAQSGPDFGIARVRKEGLSRRIAVACAIAFFLHLGLLASMTLGATLLFKIDTTDATVASAEEPPMDVSLVTEPDPPPPPEVVQEPPPPPDPPPPAPPEIPIPVAPLPPPDPLPITTPEPPAQPIIDTPPAPPPPKLIEVRHPVAQPVTPTVVDAGPSDYLNAPQPKYPLSALRQREQGTVVLKVIINDSGEPLEVTIEQSSGFAILDETARKQVADSYRFKAGNSRILRVPIAFQLVQ